MNCKECMHPYDVLEVSRLCHRCADKRITDVENDVVERCAKIVEDEPNHPSPLSDEIRKKMERMDVAELIRLVFGRIQKTLAAKIREGQKKGSEKVGKRAHDKCAVRVGKTHAYLADGTMIEIKRSISPSGIMRVWLESRPQDTIQSQQE